VSPPSDSAQALFASSDAGPYRIHMSGIGGVGMAGLAVLLKSNGHRVSGSELVENPLTDWLQERGISVSVGHHADYLPEETDLVIRTPAVSDANPELLSATARGLPILRRGEVLPQMLKGRTSIAVSGTHGKTTTSSMVAHVLKKIGTDPGEIGTDPGWCIGGVCPSLKTVAEAGNGALVVEADESDGTLVHYHPTVAVVTNVEFDHMEYFADEAAFEACFEQFISQSERLVYASDDPVARKLAEKAGPAAIAFGIGDGNGLQASSLELDAGGSRADLRFDGVDAGSIRLNVPGEHNLRNALAALAAVHALGHPLQAAAEALEDFVLPDRRFQLVANVGGIQVISDYAHHPSEIRTVLASAAGLKHQRLIGVFQPHRYTRTRALSAAFPPSFEGLDHLVLTPVYAASEEPVEGGRIEDLFQAFEKHGSVPVECASSLKNAWEILQSLLRSGDVLLVVGAGDVCRVAEWAKEFLDSPDSAV
jgi:UDP-N-acetylmuramate--alanine ligase